MAVISRLAAIATRRPLIVMVVVALAAGVAAVSAAQLQPNAAPDTLVGSSEAYDQTQRFAQTFGGDPVVILVRGKLTKMVLGPDLGRMLGLEGCLSGNLPVELRDDVNVPPVCKELAQLKPATVVYGPGTFVNTAAAGILDGLKRVSARSEARAKRAEKAARGLAEVQGMSPAQGDQLAAEARKLANVEATAELLKVALKYGITSPPSINSQEFVARVVFDPASGVEQPKSRFAYLFPSQNSALIQMRLRANLTAAERTRAIELTRRAVAESSYKLDNGKYVVTGAPVVFDGLQSSVGSAVRRLALVAFLVMAFVLPLVFWAELRLLPLVLAGMGAALVFGLLSVVGAGLTVASIAVLPLLVGLGVDYAVQVHARVDEKIRAGLSGSEAVRAVADHGMRPVLVAAAATSAGFAALLLSPVPMMRSFVLTLVAGIGIVLLCIMTAGFAALGWATGAPAKQPGALFRRLPTARAKRGFAYAIRRPSRVLAVGLLLAVVGWGAETQTRVVTDIRDLVPSDLPVISGVDALQKETGVSGEIDVVVRAKDVTDPTVVRWMTRYQRRVLEANGYRGERARCRQAALCPALSLGDLIGKQSEPTRKQIRSLLAAVPPYFSRSVVNSERTAANMAFGIRLVSLDRQKEVVDSMRAALDPPAGVSAAVVGLPVLAADANAQLSSLPRRTLLLLVALLAVLGVLTVALGGVRFAIVPLVPIALATGWAGLVTWLTQLALNPMSVALAVFVVAVTAEFSVLIYMRYRSEVGAGAGMESALRTAYSSTGAAVFASATTAIVGFFALGFTDIRMLRDFAFVAVVDLVVSLLGVMFVLPAAVAWFEGRSSPDVVESTI